MPEVSRKLSFGCSLCKHDIAPGAGYWNAFNQIVCGKCSFKISTDSLEPEGLHPELIMMIKEQFGQKVKK